ncbi:hypothetical protein T484DRAFT_1805417, partial [Baffinella frigidus]
VVKEDKEPHFETWSPMTERRARMPSLDTINAAKNIAASMNAARKIAAAVDHSAAESVAEMNAAKKIVAAVDHSAAESVAEMNAAKKIAAAVDHSAAESVAEINAAKKIAAAVDHSAAESVAEACATAAFQILQNLSARATAAFQILQNLSVHPPAVTIALSGLEYTVNVGENEKRKLLTDVNAVGKNEKRKLLTDVNAVFEPGMLIALMGSSGAGKTTLMDVIAGRKTGGEIAGRILVNGHNQVRDSVLDTLAGCDSVIDTRARVLATLGWVLDAPG